MLTFASISDKGERDVNEDSIGIFVDGNNRLFILCDGLGGHGMGDAASKLVCDVFGDRIKGCADPKSFLEETFPIAQDILIQEQILLKAVKKMKTTAAALLLDESKAYIGHIGDSRVYVFSKNKIKTRTVDHSVPQMLVFSKEIKESEIRFHPDRNRLLKVMGTTWEGPMYETIKPITLKKCQAFLLCSDGFWEFIEEEKMTELLSRSESAEDWLEKMVNEVKMNGEGKNMDNYSAIAVWNTK